MNINTFNLLVLLWQDVETGVYMVEFCLMLEARLAILLSPTYLFNYTPEFRHSVIALAISCVCVCVSVLERECTYKSSRSVGSHITTFFCPKTKFEGKVAEEKTL